LRFSAFPHEFVKKSFVGQYALQREIMYLLSVFMPMKTRNFDGLTPPQWDGVKVRKGNLGEMNDKKSLFSTDFRVWMVPE
jgi:hypothetical protein